MALLSLRVLGSEARFMRTAAYVRGALKIAPLLREAMAERGYSPKELAIAMAGWAKFDPAHRKALDWRTIKHAMEGSCELDTFLMFTGFFGWRFAEAVLAHPTGSDFVTALEQEAILLLNEARTAQHNAQRARAAQDDLREARAWTAGDAR